MEELVTESIVRHLKTFQLLGAKTPKKTPQSVPMGEVWQTEKRWNQPIVDQRLSILDSTNSSNNGKHVR